MNINFVRSLTGGLALALGLLGAAPQNALAQTAARRPLEGIWRGQWAAAAGPQELVLTIIERSGNRLAVLDAEAQNLRRVPVRTALRADSVFFDADRVDQHFAGVRTPDGQQLRGTWRQGIVRKPLTLQFAGVSDVLRRVLVAAPPYRADAATLTAPADNARLAGTLTVPEGPGPFATVLLLSDLGPDDRDARHGNYQLLGSLADYLARQGYAVLRLDDRGVGQSGGTATGSTVAQRTADATQALAWLRTQPRLDPLRVGIFGHGEGGNVALMAATAPLPPAFVVAAGASGQTGAALLAAQPVMYGKELGRDTTEAARQRQRLAAQVKAKAEADAMRREGANAAQIETYLDQQRLRQKAADRKYLDANFKHQKAMLEIVRQTADPGQAQTILTNMMRQRYPDLPAADVLTTARQLTTPTYKDFVAFDPQPALAQVKCPVLLLFGAEDQQTPATPNAELLQKGLKANKAVAVRRLPGVNHVLQAPQDEWLFVDGRPQPLVSPEAEEALRDWLQGVK